MSSRFMIVHVLCLFYVFFVSGCHQQKNLVKNPIDYIERTGRIKDLKTGRALTSSQLASILAAHEYVIVGEKHDNPSHHKAEYWLINKLSDTRLQGSVLMEMITSDQQQRIDQVQKWIKNTGNVRESRVRELISWNENWSWDMYGNLVIQAMHSPFRLMSANISNSEITEIYKYPHLPEGALSSQYEVRDAIRKIIVGMHGGEISDSSVESMLAVQQQRDREMAKQLISAPVPAILIAGGYHAARNTGVPLHIHDLDSQVLPVVLMLAEEGMHIISEQADYVWYFPALTDVTSERR